MKKVIFALGTLLLMMSLTACAESGEDLAQTGAGTSAVTHEGLTQSGSLKDYSENVSISAYKGMRIEVASAEVTEEEFQNYLAQAVEVYNSFYVEDGAEKESWSDEMVQVLSNGQYTTTAAYEEYLRGVFANDKLEKQKTEYLDQIWEEIIGNSTFSGISDEEIGKSAEEYYSSSKEQFEYYATFYNLSYEEYLQQYQNMTDAEFQTLCKEYALREKQRIIASSAIFYAEGLDFTDAMFDEGVVNFYTEYGYDSAEEFLEKFGEDYVREVLISNLVDEKLLEWNTMTVK